LFSWNPPRFNPEFLLAPFILTTSSKETEDGLNTSINIAGHGTLEVLVRAKKKEWVQLDLRRKKAAAEY
jgi:hypothetical protein